MTSLRSLFATEERAKQSVDTRLQDLNRRFLENAGRLDLTATQAPTESAEADLRQLAAAHRQSADLLRDALIGRRASVPTGLGPIPGLTGVNHWARTTEDLVALQQAHGDVLDAAADILESHPELTPLFEVLTRRTSENITHLRGMIARADPQAFN